ncbi:MAG: exodeoxyribonuclease III [Spirochaetales bacterium]|nr:exodeoxyribonuclease III [Spirochaetales bacterium]
MKLLSWNVNGIRAVHNKGFLDWFAGGNADVVCLQETKARPEQLPAELTGIPGYEHHWAWAVRKGYSGVGVYTRIKPLDVSLLGVKDFDDEGRTLVLDFDGFTLYNCYFPNSQAEGARLDYKLAFCEALQEHASRNVNSGRNVVICGDYNVAHMPIDLANPKSNEKNPGYLPEERAWMTSFLDSGFIDTFRKFDDRPGQYSWWSYRMNAREKNIGWRIDYFCVNSGFNEPVRGAGIQSDVYGSDHCPVSIELDIER